MKLEVRHVCSDYTSYRAARVKSLFNAEKGCNFDLDAEIPVEGMEWNLACAPRLEIGAMRACRMVVLPEWQGAGIGMRFLNAVCEHQVSGGGRYGDRPKAVYFHTSHPGLCSALRRDKHWSQVSAVLYGGDKKKSQASIAKSNKSGRPEMSAGYGGHFRAVQGFKFTLPEVAP